MEKILAAQGRIGRSNRDKQLSYRQDIYPAITTPLADPASFLQEYLAGSRNMLYRSPATPDQQSGGLHLIFRKLSLPT